MLTSPFQKEIYKTKGPGPLVRILFLLSILRKFIKFNGFYPLLAKPYRRETSFFSPVWACIFMLFGLQGCTQTVMVEVHGDEKVCFKVEIADSFFKHRKGLMYRQSLAQEEGMLFVYPESAVKSFWMKHMKIPLDIIFINKEKRIVNIEPADPCTRTPCKRYYSRGKIRYILEINRGLSKRYGFKPGTLLNFNL